MTDLEFIHLDYIGGIKLRTARENAGLSQSELANMVSASARQIEQYEKGDYDIALDRLFEIANKLGVTVADILSE